MDGFSVYYGPYLEPAMFCENFDSLSEARNFADYLENRGFPCIELEILES